VGLWDLNCGSNKGIKSLFLILSWDDYLGLLQVIEKTFESVSIEHGGVRLFIGDLLSMSTTKKAVTNNLPDYGKSPEPIITSIGGFHLDMVAAQGSLFRYSFLFFFCTLLTRRLFRDNIYENSIRATNRYSYCSSTADTRKHCKHNRDLIEDTAKALLLEVAQAIPGLMCGNLKDSATNKLKFIMTTLGYFPDSFPRLAFDSPLKLVGFFVDILSGLEFVRYYVQSVHCALTYSFTCYNTTTNRASIFVLNEAGYWSGLSDRM
jgi:hypothetical protein